MNKNISPLISRVPSSGSSTSSLIKFGVLTTAVIFLGSPLVFANTLTTNTLTIAPTGILDLKTNNLIVKTGIAGAPTGGMYNGISGYVQRGLYNGPNGFWDGPGINSSAAAIDATQSKAVGILDNAAAGYTSWPPLDPHPLTGAEILVKYTYFGDADLDGAITAADYQLIDSSVGQNAFGWISGDFDYDGIGATVADYQLIDAGFSAYKASGGQVLSLAPSGSVDGVGAAVPEPGALGLIGMGLLALVRRNRQAGSNSN